MRNHAGGIVAKKPPWSALTYQRFGQGADKSAHSKEAQRDLLALY